VELRRRSAEAAQRALATATAVSARCREQLVHADQQLRARFEQETGETSLDAEEGSDRLVLASLWRRRARADLESAEAREAQRRDEAVRAQREVRKMELLHEAIERTDSAQERRNEQRETDERAARRSRT
jgi:hypothetical protein